MAQTHWLDLLALSPKQSKIIIIKRRFLSITVRTQAFSMVTGKKFGDFRFSGSFRFFRTDNWDFTDFVQDSTRFSEGFPSMVNQIPDNNYANKAWAIPISLRADYKDFYIGTESYLLNSKKGLENVSLNYDGQQDNRRFYMNFVGWEKEWKQTHFLNIECQYTKEWFWDKKFNFSVSAFDELVENGRSSEDILTQTEIYQNFAEFLSQEQSSGSTRHRLNALYQKKLGEQGSLSLGYTFDRLDLLGIALSNTDESPPFNEEISEDNPQRKPFYLTNKHGFFAQYKNTFLNQKLHLTLGARADRHTIYEWFTNFRGGLVYTPTDKIFIKLLYGQSFREPNIFEQGALLGEANLGLVPARLNGYELSFTKLIGDYFQFFATIYRNNITNLIVPSATLNFINSNENLWVLGSEMRFSGEIGRVKTEINYTYTDPKNQVVANQEVDALNNYKHRLNANIRLRLWEKLYFTTRWNYYGEITGVHGNKRFENTLLNTIPATQKWNFILSSPNWYLRGMILKFNLILQNAFNTAIYQPNIRKGGGKQFMQLGRQLQSRVTFQF